MRKKEKRLKEAVKKGYSEIARKGSSCGCSSSCCGQGKAESISKTIGYTDKEMKAVPDGANLGLGCGNPVALASLKKGETVLDLGSGAGFDAFLAAAKVGKTGKIIGVDMTPAMLERARRNAARGGYTNVEFRKGEIEDLPVEDGAVDAIISNCVINLSPDKQSVFKEAFRVLRPGGRLMVSDLVLIKALPVSVKRSVEAYVGCLAGAVKKPAYVSFIKKAGFKNINILSQDHYPVEAMANDATAQAVISGAKKKRIDPRAIERSVVSVKIHAIKPAKKAGKI